MNNEIPFTLLLYLGLTCFCCVVAVVELSVFVGVLGALNFGVETSMIVEIERVLIGPVHPFLIHIHTLNLTTTSSEVIES